MMNRRSTINAGVVVGAVVGILGVAYGVALSSTRPPARGGTGPNTRAAPVPGSGRAPIPEVAVAPGVGAGPVSIVPPFPRIISSSDDEPEAATSVHVDELEAQLAAMPMASSLSAADRENLVWIREEERLAHDLNVALARRWGNGPFANVGAAEATHTEAVRLLIDRYGVADPAPGTVVGVYRNLAFSRLYQELVTTGSASYVDGLKVGARIQERAISDLRARASTLPDISRVYADLERGSRNHLRAFVRQIERHGAQYAPTHVSQSEYDAIVGSALEAGARSDGY